MIRFQTPLNEGSHRSMPQKFRSNRLIPALLAGALVLFLASTGEARPARVSQIPNGFVNSCLNCHFSLAGGARNPFGTEIEFNFLSIPGPAGVVQWGPALAALNNDLDGASNGAELNDPAGAWSQGMADPGDPGTVTNPGFDDVSAVPFLAPFGLIALGSAMLGVGSLAARTRRRD